MINIIRSSANTPEAKNRLIERFSLTDVQAQAIVDMRLRALTGLEREKIEAEYAELMDRIAELKAILADEKKLLGVIREEILLIAENTVMSEELPSDLTSMIFPWRISFR